MKRFKERGALYWKKREEDEKKYEGSLLKYFGTGTCDSRNSSVTENEETCAWLETSMEHGQETDAKDSIFETLNAPANVSNPADEIEHVTDVSDNS